MNDETGRLLQAALDFTAQGRAAFGYVEAREVVMQVLPDAAVTGRHFEAPTRFTGAVYDGRGELVRSSLGFSEGDFAPLDPGRIDPGRRAAARRLPQALYGGTLYPILGHFLFETVARLWHGVDLGRPSPARRLPVVFHPWLELELSAFLRNPLYRRILEALGIAAGDIVLAEEDLQVGVLYYPSPLSIYHVTLHPLMGHVIDHLAAELMREARPFRRVLSRKPEARRLFLSRSRWQVHRRVGNEAALEELFRARGFSIVHPQDTEPKTLVELLQGAAIVASTDGSQAHLAAFCRPGTRTLLIDTRPVPTQFAIEKLRQLRGLHVPVFANGLWNPEDGRLEASGTMERLLDAALRLQAE